MSKCEYCRGIEEFADFNGNENRTAPIIYVLDNILSVVHYPYGSNSSFECEYKINYCPMCGEKLGGR